MKWQPQKPNTKPIYILPINTNIKPSFYLTVLRMPTTYQENAKKLWKEILNTDLVLVFPWYAKFWVTD